MIEARSIKSQLSDDDFVTISIEDLSIVIQDSATAMKLAEEAKKAAILMQQLEGLRR